MHNSLPFLGLRHTGHLLYRCLVFRVTIHMCLKAMTVFSVNYMFLNKVPPSLFFFIVFLFFIHCTSSSQHFIIHLKYFLKSVNNKTEDPKWSCLCQATCPQTKTWVNYHFGSPRNRIINQPIRNPWISTNEVICLIEHCHLLKENNLAISDLLFLPSITSSFLLPSGWKTFSFVQFLRIPFYQMGWIN